jgi:hypothetical protein
VILSIVPASAAIGGQDGTWRNDLDHEGVHMHRAHQPGGQATYSAAAQQSLAVTITADDDIFDNSVE